MRVRWANVIDCWTNVISYSRIRLSSLREIDSPTRDIVSSVSSVTQGDCGDAGVSSVRVEYIHTIIPPVFICRIGWCLIICTLYGSSS